MRELREMGAQSVELPGVLTVRWDAPVAPQTVVISPEEAEQRQRERELEAAKEAERLAMWSAS